MPRVPTVDPYQVAPAPLRGGEVRTAASADLLQSGVARQLGEAGRIGAELAQGIQDREDTTAVLQAEADVKGRYLEWEASAKQRRGTAAYGLHDEAVKWWDEAASKASEGLTPRQRAAFEKTVLPAVTHARGAMSSYEQGQRREALDQSVVASINASISTAAADPAAVPQARAELARNVAIRANNHGWDAETTKAAQLEVTTKLHHQVIQQLALKDPGRAAAYFEQHKGEIDGTQHAELGKFAEQATAARSAETAVAEVWTASGPKSDRDPVQTDKLSGLIRERFKDKPETAKLALASLHQRIAEHKDARHERDQEAEAKVNIALMNGAGATQVMRMPEFMAMGGEQQRKFMEHIENQAVRRENIAASRASRAAAEESRAYTAGQRKLQQLHLNTFSQYYKLADSEVLSKMSYNEVVNQLPNLGHEHTDRLIQKWESLKKGGVADARIDDDTFKQIAREMKLPVDKHTKTEADAAMLGTLKYRVERVIEAAQKRAGKPLAPAEKEAMMRREMALTVSVPGSWPWSDNQQLPVIGLTPQQLVEVVVPSADKLELQAKMAEMYKKTGSEAYRPSAEQLRRFYARSISKTADLIPAGK